MNKKHFKTVAFVAVLMFTVLANVHLHAAPHHVLTATEESFRIGGFSCAQAAGVTVGLAVGMLSPCSFVCGALAMYSMMPMLAMGC